MESPTATPQRILASALEVVARLGSQRLTMADLSRQSGLSRGTIYRYFSTREDVLEALTAHLRETFASGLREAITACPELDQRVETVVGFVLSFTGNPKIADTLDVDPSFIRTFLCDYIDQLIAPVAQALEPVAANGPRDPQRIDPTTVAEMLVRLAVSYQLVPPGGRDAASALRDSAHRMLGSGATPASAVPAQKTARHARQAGSTGPRPTSRHEITWLSPTQPTWS